MKLYLSSFRLGNTPQALANLYNKKKKAAVIVNAIDDMTKEIREQKEKIEYNDLYTIGISVEELDLRNYFGKKEVLKEKIQEYGLLWIRGGNTFILRRAMYYSGLDHIINEKISDKYFVYAGYSAAICVLGPTLKGIELVDNPYNIPQGYDKNILWDGIGLIPYAIAPHYRSDHPESLAVEKQVSYYIKHNISYKTLHDGEIIVEDLC